MKPYFTDEQLDGLSKEYRTLPVDAEGRSYEPEYNGTAVRSDIVKLVSDLKSARAALEEAQQTIANLKEELTEYKNKQQPFPQQGYTRYPGDKENLKSMIITEKDPRLQMMYKRILEEIEEGESQP